MVEAKKLMDEARHERGQIQIPYQPLLALSKLNPAPYLRLQNGTTFLYPTAKLRSILQIMEGPGRM